jgi:Fe2+ or Zn2+ uptake regulation protein
MNKKQEHAAVEQLRAKGLKVTDGRVAVLHGLMHAHEPMVIDQIAHMVPSLNVVTLYRMLKQFVDCGLVYQTDFRAGKAYFEYQEHHHHHIVCTSCGAQESVEQCVPDTYVQRVASNAKKFSAITTHALEFFGVCNKCTK